MPKSLPPPNAKNKAQKNKSPLEKVIEYLIKYTIVPREKSPIQWQMDKVFNFYRFETEVKGKIYTFDGRHFYVYPAGYELPPGVRIGDKSGPELLLHVRVDAMPKPLGELWQRLCGQHEKELAEDKKKWDIYVAEVELRSRHDKEKAIISAKDILDDFKS